MQKHLTGVACVCVQCGDTFRTQPYLIARGRKYCSDQCYRLRPPNRNFWKFVNKTESCWLWTGGTERFGYGGFNDRNGRRRAAHRVSWEYANGPIPPGVFVLHKCDNPRCVNPDHLFLGTQMDNMRDAFEKRRHAHGEGHYRAKLNAEAVVTIRQRYAAGEMQKQLAAEFGVHQSIISEICSRKRWRHVA